MKKILLLILIVITLICVVPVDAYRYSFQDYNPSGLAGWFGTGAPTILYDDALHNEVQILSGGAVQPYIGSISPVAFTYLAFDSGSFSDINLYDSSFNRISDVAYTPSGTSRAEMRIIGGTPTLFFNGTQVATGANVSVNPSYFAVDRYAGGFFTNVELDNIVWGENDHNVIGALPVNFSVVRDFFNNAASGVYAAYNATSFQPAVQKNANTMYIDADMDSTSCPGTETLNIANSATGTVINSTVLNCAMPQQKIAYDLTKLLSPGPTIVPDGKYSVYFTGSSVVEYFWIVSNGGSITFDKPTYNIGDSGSLSWYLSSSYIDLSTYVYTYQIVDVNGNVKASGITATTNTDTSGTVKITFNPSTYTQGVYFAEMVATNKNDGTQKIMAQSPVTLTSYLNFFGTVYSGNLTTPLTGATVTISQGSIIGSYTTLADGIYSLTGYGTGALLWINASAPGYKTHTFSTVPLSTKNQSVDIALDPLEPNTTGVALGGTAGDTTYGNIIPYATIYIWNTTTGYSTIKTANIRGYYYCDNTVQCSLTNNTLYNVQGNQTGYTPSGIYKVMVSGS